MARFYDEMFSDQNAQLIEIRKRRGCECEKRTISRRSHEESDKTHKNYKYYKQKQIAQQKMRRFFDGYQCRLVYISLCT